jgi:hypothetical protein
MINSMTKHFMFHINWISVLRFIYVNFFVVVGFVCSLQEMIAWRNDMPIHPSIHKFCFQTDFDEIWYLEIYTRHQTNVIWVHTSLSLHDLIFRSDL